jgi:hypothetical protein
MFLLGIAQVMVEQKAGGGELTISADGGQHRLPTNLGGLSVIVRPTLPTSSRRLSAGSVAHVGSCHYLSGT